MLGLLFAADLMDIQPGLIFWTLVTFLVLAFVLSKIAWGPILRLVEERERSIHGDLEGAKNDRAESAKLLVEQRALVADARREAAEAMKKALADAEVVRAELAQKSRKEAEALLAHARQQIAEDTHKAQAELKGLVVDLAIDVATKLLGSELADGARQRALAQGFVKEIPHRERADA